MQPQKWAKTTKSGPAESWRTERDRDRKGLEGESSVMMGVKHKTRHSPKANTFGGEGDKERDRKIGFVLDEICCFTPPTSP
jgi:hypothetical protein